MQTLFDDTELEFRATVSRLSDSVRIANPGDLDVADRDEVWKRLAGAGLLELRVRDGDRPIGSGIEVMIACEALGAALVPAPYIGSAVMAIELLERAHADAGLVAEVAAGSRRFGILLRPDMADLATWRAGEPAIVFDGDGAEEALALADGSEPRVVRVPIASAPSKGIDLTRSIATIELPAAGTEVIGEPLTRAALDRWRALALVALTADQVGLMRAVLGLAVEYSKEREAFGTHIGTFQALQHMCAEAHVEIEAAFTLVKYAAYAVDGRDVADALDAARVAKGHASSSIRPVVESCIQVFGGIGHTWDHIAHFYLRRGLLDRELLGSERDQFTVLGADAVARRRAER